MSNNEEKEDTDDAMINTPEGFDARTHQSIQPSSAGISIRLVARSNWTQIACAPSQLRAMASRQPWALRSSQKEAGTITRCSLIRGNSSRLEFADPRSQI